MQSLICRIQIAGYSGKPVGLATASLTTPAVSFFLVLISSNWNSGEQPIHAVSKPDTPCLLAIAVWDCELISLNYFFRLENGRHSSNYKLDYNYIIRNGVWVPDLGLDLSLHFQENVPHSRAQATTRPLSSS